MKTSESPPRCFTASKPFPIAPYLLQHKKARPLSKLNPKYNSESLLDDKNLKGPKLTDGAAEQGIGRRHVQPGGSNATTAQGSHHAGARANNVDSRQARLQDALNSAHKRFPKMLVKYEQDGNKRLRDAEEHAQKRVEFYKRLLEEAEARNKALHDTVMRILQQDK